MQYARLFAHLWIHFDRHCPQRKTTGNKKSQPDEEAAVAVKQQGAHLAQDIVWRWEAVDFGSKLPASTRENQMFLFLVYAEIIEFKQKVCKN